MNVGILSECSNFVSRITNLSKTKLPIDIKMESQNFTINVISRVALGGRSPESEYFYDKQFAVDIQNIFSYVS